MRPLLALALFVACAETTSPGVVQVAASAEALSETSVLVRFTAPIASAEGIAIRAPLRGDALAVESLEISAELLTLKTARQIGGERYSVDVSGVRFVDIELADAPSQVAFEGFGTAPVIFSLDTRGRVVPGPLAALATFDPETGRPSRELRSIPLADEDADGVYTATSSARIGAASYSARAVVVASGAEAAGATTFSVSSTAAVRVTLAPKLARLPEFEPPTDATPGDGKAPVRIILDDRAARALVSPAMRLALDAEGRFDLALARIERARPVPGKPRVYEILVEVAVDPRRTLEGSTPDTFPYVSFLVNDGEDVNERAANFVVPTEAPRLVIVPIGNPSLVPVTFRVDIGAAVLEPDLRLRGKYPGEGIFLTGEFPNSEDALGRLAADAFSGGERATLEMQERPDAPGIFEKVVFMPPNRPYGWKVVRCPTRVGCAELNRKVLSSGRAFPTVMKNLTTSNEDAGGSSAIAVVDPASLAAVRFPDGHTADYSRARVSETGMEPPSTSVLFKQEAPDLVVQVGAEPVITPIVVVGTWRDVNIPGTPAELLGSMNVLDLGPYDYDDGRMGRAAPVRERELPVDPGTAATPPGVPSFDASDGVLDAPARSYGGGGSRLPLHVAWNERVLYVATEPARAGVDRFIMISLDPPDMSRASHWAKAGTEAFSARTVFLAMEGDGDFSGWFSRTTDLQLMAPSARGAVLEGAIEPSALGLGAPGPSIWIAALEFGTADGGALEAARQWPAGNGDGNLDAMELFEVSLAEVRASP